MNETEFWNLIAASKRDSQGDSDRQLELLERALAGQPEAEILDFDRLLHEQMARSYTRELWAAAYIINGGCSDDGFDYFRAWLIAQGWKVFRKALKDPESLADVAESDAGLELLLYVASKAFETKTGEKFPRRERPRVELTGDEWSEDEEALQAKYPKLFAEFSGSDSVEKPEVARGGLAPVADLLQALLARNPSAVAPVEALYQQAVIAAMAETPQSLAKSAAMTAC